MNVFLSVYIFCFYSQNGFTNRFLKNAFYAPDEMKNKHTTLPVVKQIKIMYLHQTVDRDIFHNNSDINNIDPNLTPEVASLPQGLTPHQDVLPEDFENYHEKLADDLVSELFTQILAEETAIVDDDNTEYALNVPSEYAIFIQKKKKQYLVDGYDSRFPIEEDDSTKPSHNNLNNVNNVFGTSFCAESSKHPPERVSDYVPNAHIDNGSVHFLHRFPKINRVANPSNGKKSPSASSSVTKGAVKPSFFASLSDLVVGPQIVPDQCPLQAKLAPDTVTQDYQAQDPLWGYPAIAPHVVLRAKPVRLGLQTHPMTYEIPQHKPTSKMDSLQEKLNEWHIKSVMIKTLENIHVSKITKLSLIRDHPEFFVTNDPKKALYKGFEEFLDRSQEEHDNK